MRSRVRILGAALALVVSTGVGISAQSQAALAADNVWSAPHELSSFPTSMFNPQAKVAFDSTGRAIAVWNSNISAPGFRVQASTSTDGGATWTPPVVVSTTGFAYDPQISFDSTGRAFAVWYIYNSGNRVQASTSSDGGITWSSPTDLSIEAAANPRLSIDASNRVVVVWATDVGRIEATSSTNGGVSWSSPASISPVAAISQYPDIRSDSNDNTTAVWSANYGAVSRAQASTTTDGGVTWSSYVYVSGDALGVGNAHIEFDSSGRAFAVWNSYFSTFNVAQVNVSSDGGLTWGSPVSLSPDELDSSDPHVTVDSAGRAIVMWSCDDGVGLVSQASSSNDGGATWTAPVDVSTGGEYAYSPDLDADSTGRALAVWHQPYADYRYAIMSASSIDGGLTWSVPVAISALDGNAMYPTIALNAAGNAISVWHDYRDTDNFYIMQESHFSFPLTTQDSEPVLANTGLDSSALSVISLISAGLVSAGALAVIIARRRLRASQA